MKKWQVVLLIVGIFLFISLVQLIVFKDKVTKKLENIKKLKSEIRMMKAKYIQVLRMMGVKGKVTVGNYSKMSGSLKNNGRYSTTFGDGNTSYGYSFNLNKMHEFDDSYVNSLQTGLYNVQQKLNEAINNYNLYISRLFRIPYAKLFKCKKEEYIDELNLDKSTELSDIDGYGI